MKNDKNFESRLVSLERSMLRWRLSSLFLAACLSGLLIGGLASKGGQDQVVRASAFEVVDEVGRLVGGFGLNDDGVSLWIGGDSESHMIDLRSTDLGPSLFLNGFDGNPRFSLFSTNVMTSASMHTNESKSLSMIMREGDSMIQLFDQDENPRLRFRVHERGPEIFLLRKDGRDFVSGLTHIDGIGPQLFLANSDNDAIVSASVGNTDGREGPFLDVRSSDGKLIFYGSMEDFFTD